MKEKETGTSLILSDPGYKKGEYYMDTVFNEKRLRESKESIVNSLPFYGSILDFYEKIFNLQEKEKLELSPDPVILDEKETLSYPVIEKSMFKVDWDRAEKLLSKILEIAEKENEDLKESVNKFKDGIEKSSFNFTDMLKDTLSSGRNILNFAEENELPFDTLYVFLYNSVKPYIEICSEQLSHYIKEDDYDGGNCPVCGEHPYLSVFGEDGKRELLCGFCNHKWRSKRIFCPFCESEDREMLKYFHSDDLEFQRVDLCDECMSFIKCVDLRKLERAFYPPFEFLSTGHLDLKAKELGYFAGNPI